METANPRTPSKKTSTWCNRQIPHTSLSKVVHPQPVLNPSTRWDRHLSAPHRKCLHSTQPANPLNSEPPVHKFFNKMEQAYPRNPSKMPPHDTCRYPLRLSFRRCAPPCNTPSTPHERDETANPRTSSKCLHTMKPAYSLMLYLCSEGSVPS